MKKPDSQESVVDGAHTQPLARIRELVAELHALLAGLPAADAAPPIPKQRRRRPRPNLQDLRPSPEMMQRMAKVRRRLGLDSK